MLRRAFGAWLSTSMTPDDETQKAWQIPPDWTRLASDALDLWQTHLTSLANDPKAKEEMARFIAPMSQMFAFWTDMAQQGTTAYAATTEPAAEPKAKSDVEPVSSEPAAATSAPEPDGAGNVGEPLSESKPEAEPAPLPDPVSESKPAEPEPTPEPVLSSTHGDAPPTDRARNLAELAERLVYLERELEGIRARKRGGSALRDDDDSHDGDFQRVVGAD